MQLTLKNCVMKKLFLFFSVVFLTLASFGQKKPVFKAELKNSPKDISVTVTSLNGYLTGQTMDLRFLVSVGNIDYEYVDSFALVFPSGITPIDAINPFATTTEGQDPEYLNPINGQIVSWGDNDNNYGGIEPGEYEIWVRVHIDDTVTGEQIVQWYASGDEYAGSIHEINGTDTVAEMMGALITFNVFSGTNPVADASVKVFNLNNELVFDLLTNDQGLVTQPMEVGTYNYLVEKFGYLTFNGQFTVENGVNDTIDVELIQNISYDVTFTVKNILNNPLVGALVQIAKNDVVLFEANTDSLGICFFENVPVDQYTFNVHYIGYENINDSTLILSQDTTINIILNELILPVRNLQANVNGYNVELTWQSPSSDNSFTRQWDDGINYNGIGTNNAVQFAVAHRYDVNDLANIYEGAYITKISFFPRFQGATYTVKIWQGTDAGSLTEVYSQEATNVTINTWNTVTLDTPYVIDKSKELWVGYHINTQGGYPAGCDASLDYPGKGNKIYWGGAWYDLTDLAPSLTYDWNIKFEYVEDYFDGTYNVYVDDVLNNQSAVEDESYTITNLTAGTYTIGVTAVYETGESMPVEVEVTVTVINENGIRAAIAPNPTKGLLTISADDAYMIELMDLAGRVVAKKIMKSNVETLDLTNQTNGMYILKLSNDSKSHVTKIIKN